MNTSLASGNGVSAIRSLRTPQKGTTTTTITANPKDNMNHSSDPANWSKEQLSQYIQNCGLQEIVPVLASLHADGRMLNLLCDAAMVKYAIADSYKRTAFVTCVRSACAGTNVLSTVWNVNKTIEWLCNIELESKSKDDIRKSAKKCLIHGAYLCHLTATSTIETVLNLSKNDANTIKQLVVKNEDLKILSRCVVLDEVISINDNSKTTESNDGWGGPKVNSAFSDESVQMPSSSKKGNGSGSNGSNGNNGNNINNNVNDNNDSSAKRRIDSTPDVQPTVLSTPRYSDEDKDEAVTGHRNDGGEKGAEKGAATTTIIATTSVTNKQTQQALQDKKSSSSLDGVSLLLPLPQYQEEEEKNGEPNNDGFFSKVLWDRSHILGRGAFGAVYKGYDAGSGCFVAIKEFLTTDREELNHQIEEIKLLKSLIHPNVVSYLGAEMRERVNDWGATEPVLCIATELLAGGSIGSIVASYGPLEEGVVQTYTNDILHGLSYLHEQKLVHRDIKPENILISVDGRAKIGDFGESKFLQASMTAKDENLTMKGTPYFMAPEVLLEDGHGRKADIWSVGATVLQMSTGFPPWRENGFKQIVQLLLFLGRQPKAVPTIPKTCSQQLTSFVKLCLQRQPALRLSAKDLLKHEFITDPNVSSYVSGRRKSFCDKDTNSGEEENELNGSGNNTIKRIITRGEQIFS
jgi:hypothetical protein